MKINPEQKFESPSQEQVHMPDVPDIYKLIKISAGTEEIVNQISRDYFLGNHEAICLGLQELQSRGRDGHVALNEMSVSSDALAPLASRLLANPKMDSLELEILLGIRRFGVIDNHDWKMVSDGALLWHKRVFAHLSNKGFLEGVDFGEYVRKVNDQLLYFEDAMYNPFSDKSPHLDQSLDNFIFAMVSTFGISEPSYLEAVGPKEVLRLRTQVQPRFLLLGSLGAYSAREIRKYSDKINPEIKVDVIDIRDKMSRVVDTDNKRRGDINSNAVTADAFHLPFRESSMNHIYSNYLIRYIANSVDKSLQYFKPLFREAAYVLKPGGSLIMVEGKLDNSYSNAGEKLDCYANEFGLELAYDSNEVYEFCLQPESCSATVDEFGFSHYNNSWISDDKGICKRYVKK